MKKTALLLFLVFGILSLKAQTRLFRGIVKAAPDSVLLSDVHVSNLNTKAASSSAGNGFFILPYEPGDTLLFTSVGYQDFKLPTGSMLISEHIHRVIYLQPQVYSLNPVNITEYKSKSEFRKAFLDIEPVEDSLVAMKLPKLPKSMATASGNGNASVVISGPITFLYNRFSKEARELRKAQKLMALESRRQVIDRKYNEAFVSKITDLKSPERIKAFMKSCSLGDEFILKATEYDIIQAVLDCMEELNILKSE